MRLALLPAWCPLDTSRPNGWICRTTPRRRWTDLLALWTAYNLHLAHVMAAVPAESLANQGTVNGNPVTLEFLMEDYVAHLEHHLRSIARVMTVTE